MISATSDLRVRSISSLDDARAARAIVSVAALKAVRCALSVVLRTGRIYPARGAAPDSAPDSAQDMAGDMAGDRAGRTAGEEV